MIDLPTDLPADLVPLSWLLGVWEGTGVIEYDAGDTAFETEFRHRVSFSHDGGDALNYAATAWVDDGDGTRRHLVAETGFWRLARPATDEDPGPALLPATRPRQSPRTADDVEALRADGGGFEIEAAVVHSDGISELYLGQVRGPRIDIATDAIVRPSGAKHYAAATRMYGLVEGDLLWAWDIAALGRQLGSHASARLVRMP
ncbi:FABP family protein [Microbacterium sp. 179-B 1A2 NHS]|uniref:FABP family protein n=1 Tax=Microbacterium sp. 179-B 1A2 NHS TaxID=3142383 RepID=UPI0039A33DFB